MCTPASESRRDHVAHDLDRVVMHDADVGQLRFLDALEQRADAGGEHLDAEEVDVRPRLRDRRGGLAHAEADLEHGRRAAAEDGWRSRAGAAVRNAERREPLLERAPLALRDVAAAHREAADVAIGRAGRFVVLVGGCGIGHRVPSGAHGTARTLDGRRRGKIDALHKRARADGYGVSSGHAETGLRSFTNITYDELEVGSSATVSRRISQTEVDALALVSGDVDAFHLVANGNGPAAGTTAKAVGAEAIISGLLSRRMPGPGTTLVSQELAFNGSITAGDELTATATVLAKRPDHIVVLACTVKRGDDELVVGTVTVRAPTRRISYSDVATPEMVLRRNDDVREDAASLRGTAGRCDAPSCTRATAIRCSARSRPRDAA